MSLDTVAAACPVFTLRYAVIDYRHCEISAKSRRRIFRVTFTRPDWRGRIFEGERVAAFSTTTIGAAASENFLVVMIKSSNREVTGIKFPMKSDLVRPLSQIRADRKTVHFSSYTFIRTCLSLWPIESASDHTLFIIYHREFLLIFTTIYYLILR